MAELPNPSLATDHSLSDSVDAGQRPVVTPRGSGSTRTSPPISQQFPPARPDRYELGVEIARGGMGVVYRATDSALGREVAIKLLQEQFSPESVAATRFVDEARITGQLQHPAIPPIHDVGVLPDGRPFLAMKLIKGRTLEDLLKARPDPGHDRGQFVAVFDQVCQAVGYAHAHKVIHRDLKPANIMVGSFGEVQVMDWGLAKVLAGQALRAPEVTESELTTAPGTEVQPTRELDEFTRAGSVLGTPAYMPPEQAIGAIDQVDQRSDVFGLGAILCVILTGRPPFVGVNSEATRQLAARAQLEDAFARLERCGADPGLVALCKRCLAKEKADRPKHGGEIAKEVAGLRAAADERARQAELDRVRAEGERAKAEAEAREQRKRRKVQLALAAAILLIVTGGGAFAWLQENRATIERERLARSADLSADHLGRCEDALRNDDAEKAGLAFDQAEKQALEGGAESLADRFARCRIDLAMLRELDEIDIFRRTPENGSLPPRPLVVSRWEQAFTGFGIVPGMTPTDEVTGRLQVSLVRERLLATLDLWLVLGPTKSLADILHKADPDDFRDAVRQAVLAKDYEQLGKLTRKDTALQQPVRFAVALGNTTLPVEWLKGILDKVAVARAGDLGVCIDLGNKSQTADDRLRWFQAAVASHPRNTAAWNLLGITLRQKKDFEGAIAVFQKAIQLDPSYIPARASLASTLREKGDLDGAIAAYQEAIRLNQASKQWGSGFLHAEIGNTLLAKKDLPGAIVEFRSALRLSPHDTHTHFELIEVLRATGKHEEADKEYAEAIRVNRRGVVSHYFSLGSESARQGDHDSTIAAYRQAIRLDPEHDGAYFSQLELGDALRSKGDLDGAIAAYKEAIRLEPATGNAHFSLAEALKAKGDLEGVVAVYREARRLNPRGDSSYSYELGHELFGKKDIDGAIAEYRKAIRDYPPPANASGRSHLANIHSNLGVALAAKGDLDGAIASQNEAIRLAPQDSMAYTNLGAVLFTKQDFDGAITALREAVRLDPKVAKAHTSLGIALCAKGNLDEAIACHKEAIHIDPKDATAFYKLGNAYYDKKELYRAIAAFQEAIRLDPKYSLALSNLGNALKAKGDLAGADAAYREAIRVDPKHGIAHYNLGVFLNDRGDREGAIAEFREAIRVSPEFTMAYNNLGNALRAMGDRDGAVAVYREAIKVAPTKAEFHYDLGISLKDLDLEEAISEFREAIKNNPKLARAYNGLGTALKTKGDLDASVAALGEAIRLEPELAPSHHNLGITLSAKGDPDGAIIAHKKAIELDPKLAAAHIGLGNALKTKGNLEAAIASYQEAVRVNPTFIPGHTSLAAALVAKGDRAGAIAATKEAIRLNPEDARLQMDLGQHLVASGDRAGAIASYRRALELEPKNVVVHVWLGMDLDATGKPEEAIDEFKKAIQIDPKNQYAHKYLGNSLKAKGDFDGAITEFWEALQLTPGDDGIPPQIRECYVAKGDIDGALKAAQEAVRLYPKVFATHHGLGDTLQFLKKDPVAAATSYREAIRINPKYAWSHNNLGTALRSAGDLDGAIAAFQQAIRINAVFATAHSNLGNALVENKDLDGAIAAYQETVRLEPKNGQVHYTLARLLATGPDRIRDGKRAVELATRACELSDFKLPGSIDTLAAAYAEVGDFDKAIEFQKKALAVSVPAWEKGEGKDSQQRLELYSQKKPYRDAALAMPEVTRPPQEAKP